MQNMKERVISSLQLMETSWFSCSQCFFKPFQLMNSYPGTPRHLIQEICFFTNSQNGYMYNRHLQPSHLNLLVHADTDEGHVHSLPAALCSLLFGLIIGKTHKKESSNPSSF